MLPTSNLPPARPSHWVPRPMFARTATPPAGGATRLPSPTAGQGSNPDCLPPRHRVQHAAAGLAHQLPDPHLVEGPTSMARQSHPGSNPGCGSFRPHPWVPPPGTQPSGGVQAPGGSPNAATHLTGWASGYGACCGAPAPQGLASPRPTRTPEGSSGPAGPRRPSRPSRPEVPLLASRPEAPLLASR